MSDLPGQQPPLLGLTLEESIAEAHQIIQQAKEAYPHVAVVALFSGGNDSTTLLHLVKDQIDFALHINTGIGIEQTREFVRDTAATMDIRLVEKRTDPTWYRHAIEQHGFPGPRAHKTMYINLKERRLEDVHRETVERRGQKVLLLSGVRGSESQRRMGHAEAVHQRKGFIWCNPLYHFADWTMWQYRREYGVARSPAADRIHKSGECLCGAYAKRGEMDEIEMWFPETAAYIRDLERRAVAAGHGRRAQWGWGADRRTRSRPLPVPCAHPATRYRWKKPPDEEGGDIMTTPSICRYCGGPLIYSGRQDSCVPGYITCVWTCERCSRPETRLQHGTGTEEARHE